MNLLPIEQGRIYPALFVFPLVCMVDDVTFDRGTAFKCLVRMWFVTRAHIMGQAFSELQSERPST